MEKPLVICAWVGGPTGRGFNSVRRHFDKEEIALIQCDHADGIVRDVDFILISERFGGRIKEDAVQRARAWDIPYAFVPLEWSRATPVLERAGVFGQRDRKREERESLEKKQKEVTKPMKTTTPTPAPYTPPPPEKIAEFKPVLKVQPSNPLLDVLNAASDEELDRALKQRTLVRAKQKAQGIVDALAVADDDVLVAVALGLPSIVRNKVIGILRDAA